MRTTAAILSMAENIKPFLVNDPHLLRQTYHCLELFVQQTTKNFLPIVLQRICALFKTEMSSLHVPRLMPQCILRIIHAIPNFHANYFSCLESQQERKQGFCRSSAILFIFNRQSITLIEVWYLPGKGRIIMGARLELTTQEWK